MRDRILDPYMSMNTTKLLNQTDLLKINGCAPTIFSKRVWIYW